ncbi:hypothetical protein ABIF23_001453 [Bradyrhizobium elkanii]
MTALASYSTGTVTVVGRRHDCVRIRNDLVGRERAAR